jgi:hypothetical protein
MGLNCRGVADASAFRGLVIIEIMLFRRRRRRGVEYVPPATPRKSV